MKVDRLFKFAKNMAEMSDFERQQVGCVAVYKNKIIGMGFTGDHGRAPSQVHG